MKMHSNMYYIKMKGQGCGDNGFDKGWVDIKYKATSVVV